MDVRLFQTDDGGEISCVAGQIGLDEGLATAVYLSCFGGNDDDSGLDGDKLRQWWGNFDETDPALQYRSQLQFLLNTLPLIPINMRRFESAAVADLIWMTDSKLASFVGATATMPALNTIKIAFKIEIQNKVFDPAFTYRRNSQ